MSFIERRVEELSRDGFDFKMGDFISKAFNVVNKEVGLFVGYAFAYLAIILVVNFIPFLNTFSFLLTTPLMFGFFIIAHRIMKNQHVEFSGFFDGFTYFVDLLIVYLIQMIIVIGAMIPFLVFMGYFLYVSITQAETLNPKDLFSISNIVIFVLTILPLIYVSVAMSFSSLFVVFHEVKPFEAVKYSFRIVNKKWFTFLGFMIIMTLLSISGLIVLGIGILYTIPVGMVSFYLAYHYIIGFESEGENLDNLENILI